jgi:hypothetical protein
MNASLRFSTVRRLYLYLVALVSLAVSLTGLDGLTRSLSEAWLENSQVYAANSAVYLRQSIAQYGGMLLVGVAVFVLHWGLAQRGSSLLQRTAAARKFFTYAALGLATGFALQNLYQLLLGLAKLAFGQALQDSHLWPSAWLYHLLVGVAACLLGLYIWRTIENDGDFGAEQSYTAAFWRRLYHLAAGLWGVVLLIIGSAAIIAALIDQLGQRFIATAYPLAAWPLERPADGLAQAAVGAILLRLSWSTWQRVIQRQPAESQAALRRLYFYAAVILGAIATLGPAAAVLYELLLRLLDGSGFAQTAELLDSLTQPLSYLPAGIVVWRWCWRALQAETVRYGESSEGATVRRIYFYAVAATGLGLLWVGAGDLLQGLLALFFPGRAVTSFWTPPLANGISLLAVGLPVWLWHWRTTQQTALQRDAHGTNERAARPRRLYLYGVSLAGALLILYYLSQIVYRLLLLLLGDPEAGLTSGQAAEDFGRGVITALLWVQHLWQIRRDGDLGSEAIPSAEQIEERRAALERRIAHLEQELQETRTELAKLQ